MTTTLVTIKLPRNPNHDPHNKVVGPCPFSDSCTDSTGEHHTGIAKNPQELEALVTQYHITRIEEV